MNKWILAGVLVAALYWIIQRLRHTDSLDRERNVRQKKMAVAVVMALATFMYVLGLGVPAAQDKTQSTVVALHDIGMAADVVIYYRSLGTAIMEDGGSKPHYDYVAVRWWNVRELWRWLVQGKRTQVPYVVDAQYEECGFIGQACARFSVRRPPPPHKTQVWLHAND
ncbi:MAG TPA: hypothetical protein EYN66_03330 [Myxococcales bacterium]|nr:hypothetical protein [Myxococcales bacterium]